MFDKDKKEYILTDPVIVSDTGLWSTSYGPCDGGSDMMVTWFNNHKCNRYCKRSWLKPLYEADVKIEASQTVLFELSSSNFSNA